MRPPASPAGTSPDPVATSSTRIGSLQFSLASFWIAGHRTPTEPLHQVTRTKAGQRTAMLDGVDLGIVHEFQNPFASSEPRAGTQLAPRRN